MRTEHDLKSLSTYHSRGVFPLEKWTYHSRPVAIRRPLM